MDSCFRKDFLHSPGSTQEYYNYGWAWVKNKSKPKVSKYVILALLIHLIAIWLGK